MDFHSAESCMSCRRCCEACPAKINIPMAMQSHEICMENPYRCGAALGSLPSIGQVENCIECGACSPRCPHGLDPMRRVRKIAMPAQQYKNK